MPDETLISLPGFAGGLNLRDAPNQLDPDQVRAILNVILDERGGATKRLGAELMANLAGRAISMHTFYLQSGGFQIVVHLSDGSVRYSTDMVNFTTIWTGLSTTDPFSFEVYNNHLYLSNGVNDYRKWSGSVATTFPTAPKGKYLRVWKDAMWVSGVAGNESRVYTSDVGNPDVFPALGFVDIHKGDGDRVMGMASTPDGLLICKLRRSHLLYDPVTFANRIVDPDKGCESHHSMIQHMGVTYLLNRYGICAYHGSGPMVVISGNIEPMFQHHILNYNALNKVWAYQHHNRLGWSVPDSNSATNNLQMEFYPTLPRLPWSLLRMNAQCFATVREGAVEHLHYGATDGNKLHRAFMEGTDDGSPIVSHLATGWFDLENPSQMKYLRRVRMLGRGKVFFSVQKDYEISIGKGFSIDLGAFEEDMWDPVNDLWGHGTWGPHTDLQETVVETDFYARSIAFHIHDPGFLEARARLMDIGHHMTHVPSGQWAIYDLHGHIYPLGDRR